MRRSEAEWLSDLVSWGERLGEHLSGVDRDEFLMSTLIFEVSANYPASGIRFTQIPAGARQVDWHTVPERVLTVRLDGSAEYQTSDGDERRVPAGSFVLFEDVDGKGHKSLHSPQAQTVLWISLPQGLENP